MHCICFPQRYAQCHLWSCAISAEWRLKHFVDISLYNSVPVPKNIFRNCTASFFFPVFCSFSFFICWWILTYHYFITLFRGVIIPWPSHCNSICLQFSLFWTSKHFISAEMYCDCPQVFYVKKEKLLEHKWWRD